MSTIASSPEAILFLLAVIAAMVFLVSSELIEARRDRRAIPVRAEKRPRLAALPLAMRRRREDAVALRRSSLD